MHLNYDGTSGFLGKVSFFNSFGNSARCQNFVIPVDVSLKWSIYSQDKLDWGAARSCECIPCSWNLKHIWKLKYAQAQGIFLEYWSAIENFAAWMWWILFWGISEGSTAAAPQSNSSYLEIDEFRETAFGSVSLRQIIYQNC